MRRIHFEGSLIINRYLRAGPNRVQKIMSVLNWIFFHVWLNDYKNSTKIEKTRRNIIVKDLQLNLPEPSYTPKNPLKNQTLKTYDVIRIIFFPETPKLTEIWIKHSSVKSNKPEHLFYFTNLYNNLKLITIIKRNNVLWIILLLLLIIVLWMYYE